MAYTSLPYGTFVSRTTISASEVNANGAAIINGLSDGTKDIGVNNATFTGGVDANSTLQVAGATTLSSTVRVAGGATFSGAVGMDSTLTVVGKAQFNGGVSGTVAYSDAVTFSGAVYAGSTLRCSGDSTFSGAMYANDIAVFDKNIIVTGSAEITTSTVRFDKPASFTSYVNLSGSPSSLKCNYIASFGDVVFCESTLRVSGGATFSAGIAAGDSNSTLKWKSVTGVFPESGFITLDANLTKINTSTVMGIDMLMSNTSVGGDFYPPSQNAELTGASDYYISFRENASVPSIAVSKNASFVTGQARYRVVVFYA